MAIASFKCKYLQRQKYLFVHLACCIDNGREKERNNCAVLGLWLSPLVPNNSHHPTPYISRSFSISFSSSVCFPCPHLIWAAGQDNRVQERRLSHAVCQPADGIHQPSDTHRFSCCCCCCSCPELTTQAGHTDAGAVRLACGKFLYGSIQEKSGRNCPVRRKKDASTFTKGQKYKSIQWCGDFNFCWTSRIKTNIISKQILSVQSSIHNTPFGK